MFAPQAESTAQPMNAYSSLRVAVFLDSRPGHRKQTLGILDSLRQLTEIETFEINVPLLPVFDEIINWIKYYLAPASICRADLKGCDLILGTGSRTHIPMLACKKKHRIPVATCMTPFSLIRKDFDLCFVPRHDHIAAADNVFLTEGPPNRARSKNMHDPGRGLILIGGMDEKSHSWDTTDIINSVSFILQQERNRVWTVSSSPRTPDETNTSLENLARKFDYVTFIPFTETGPGWIEREYDRNKTVWVTADSISMIFEAMTAGCRVGILPIRWRKEKNKFQRCVDTLYRNGLAVSFEDWKEGKGGWVSAEPLAEAQRCAREILKRWWPNRLQ